MCMRSQVRSLKIPVYLAKKESEQESKAMLVTVNSAAIFVMR